MKKISPCDTCEFRGYSPELCKLHLRKISKNGSKDCPNHAPLKEISKKVAVGAGVGVMTMFVGMAAVPAAVLKALFGHVMTTKMTAEAGGGVVGAVINVFRKNKDKKPKK
ncbi:MAG: hypothetical protein HQK79_17575 [Desulfobacterales bacterium]|nr:hypothetical protein [Desulfobacterales bacterium]